MKFSVKLTRPTDIGHWRVGDVLKVDGVQPVVVDALDWETGTVWLRPLRWYERAWLWLKAKVRR